MGKTSTGQIEKWASALLDKQKIGKARTLLDKQKIGQALYWTNRKLVHGCMVYTELVSRRQQFHGTPAI